MGCCPRWFRWYKPTIDSMDYWRARPREVSKSRYLHLSVVIDGDSTLELTNELEGIFGEEDDIRSLRPHFSSPLKTLLRRQSWLTYFEVSVL